MRRLSSALLFALAFLAGADARPIHGGGTSVAPPPSGPAFLNGGRFTSLAVEGNFGFGQWNGTNNFNYTSPAPYNRQGYNSWQGATPQTMPSALLTKFASEGAVMRIVIDPGPLNLGLQISTAQFNTLMGQIQAALTLDTNAGIQSVVDLSVRPITSVQATGFGLADTEIEGAAPSGAFYVNYKNTVAAVAAYLNSNDSPNWVALEIFNEPPTVAGIDWANVALPPLWQAARTGWPTGTIIVAGNGGATPAGLALLNIADFDANTLFTFHSYDPFEFVFQSQKGAPADMQYVSGMEFPPVPANQSGIIANATTQINADITLSPTQKTAAIALMTTEINAYYSAPRDQTWTQNLWNVATAWADANSVARNRIWMGENSVNGNSTFNYNGLVGAPDPSASTYLTFGTSWASTNGVDRGYFDLIDSPGGGNGFTLAPGLPTPVWSNLRLQALGLPLQP